MSSWGWRRADPRASAGDAACRNSGTGATFLLSWASWAGDLFRVYLPPLTSETNSGLDDQGCSLEGLKKAWKGTKNGVTETGS